MRLAMFVALTAASLVLFGCRERNGSDASSQDQVPAPPAPTADTAVPLQPASPSVGLPASPNAPPGTAGDGTVGEEVTVEIKDRKLTVSQSTIERGPVAFSFTNNDDERHTIEIVYDHGGRWRSVPVGRGGFVKMRQSLEAGPYEIYCYVPGHRARGETARFTVK